jgi:hypothetical protein
MAMAKSKRRKTNVLVVDAGPDKPARFFRLVIGGRGSDNTVREDLLVPDGDRLKTTHQHEDTPDAA